MIPLGGKPYDLAVTNNCMLRMEGAELIARIREARHSLPMLHLDDMSEPQQLNLPPDVPIITKPFSLETLLSRIEELLSRSE